MIPIFLFSVQGGKAKPHAAAGFGMAGVVVFIGASASLGAATIP
jgi:hypothetical protein